MNESEGSTQAVARARTPFPPDSPDDWLNGYVQGYAEGYRKALEWARDEARKIREARRD